MSVLCHSCRISYLLWLLVFFFFSSRRRHTRCSRDWSSDVCSSDLNCFCTGSTPAQNVDKLVPFTLKKFGKKVYTVAADYNYGQITAKWVKKFTQEHGGEVLQTDYFPLEASDFGPAITKMQAAKPNFVMSAPGGANHI